jgi:hypothetical protein
MKMESVPLSPLRQRNTDLDDLPVAAIARARNFNPPICSSADPTLRRCFHRTRDHVARHLASQRHTLHCDEPALPFPSPPAFDPITSPPTRFHIPTSPTHDLYPHFGQMSPLQCP